MALHFHLALGPAHNGAGADYGPSVEWEMEYVTGSASNVHEFGLALIYTVYVSSLEAFSINLFVTGDFRMSTMDNTILKSRKQPLCD